MHLKDERGDVKLPPIVDWPKLRAVMAQALDDKDWITVAGAYGLLALLRFDPRATLYEETTARALMISLGHQLSDARGLLRALGRPKHPLPMDTRTDETLTFGLVDALRADHEELRHRPGHRKDEGSATEAGPTARLLTAPVDRDLVGQMAPTTWCADER
jgi:hypothetical protein